MLTATGFEAVEFVRVGEAALAISQANDLGDRESRVRQIPRGFE
jgi:hypothetical protein